MWSNCAKKARVNLYHGETIFTQHSSFPPESLTRDDKAKSGDLGCIKIHLRDVPNVKNVNAIYEKCGSVTRTKN